VVNAATAISVAKPTWSPDGRHLAFVGAMDGPSSDLYLYDTEKGDITRVSAGSNQADAPTWSPNGEGDLHQEVEYIQEPMNIAPYPRALWWSPIGDGPLSRYADPNAVESDWLVFDGWRFAFHHVPASGSAAAGGLMIGDVRNGSSEKVVEAVEELAILPREDHAILMAISYVDPSGNAPATRTLYMIDSQAMVVARLPFEVHGYARLIAHMRYDQFLIETEKEGVIRVSADGNWTVLLAAQLFDNFSPSPDGLYALVERRGQPDLLATFGPNGEIDSTTTIQGDLGLSGIWRPDSSVYFNRESGAYIRPPDPIVTGLTNPLSLLAWSAWYRNPGGLLRPES